MKKLLAGIISAIMVLSLGISAIAAETITEKDGAEQIDVQAKAVYISPENMYTEAVSDGTANITTKNGTTVNVVADKPSLDGMTLNVTELGSDDEEAYKWMTDAMNGVSDRFIALDIYFTDKDGNRSDGKNDVTMTIKNPDGYANAQIYLVGTDGTRKALSSTQSGDEIAFSATGPGYYVLADNATTSGTDITIPDNSAVSETPAVSETTDASENPTASENSVPSENSKDPNAPKTGDAENTALMIALMLASAGAITVLEICNKRKKTNNK